MENKFEQLIEFIINDEDEKAKELFHEVVVEKSREIYENLMAEDEVAEEVTEDEAIEEEAVEESTDEEVAEGTEEEVEESIEEEITDETELGGDAADDLVDEIEADEEGLALEGEDEEDLEDRVVDLEDKLDELMAEFEELMADQDGEAPEEEMPMGDEEGEEEVVGDEEEEEVEMPMESEEEVAEEEQVDEAVSLKPVKADNKDHATNKKSPVPANGGAKEKLADAHPASNAAEKGRPAPSAKELPHGTTEPNPGPATAAEKADKAENKKSPV
jgi:hypothetical protein